MKLKVASDIQHFARGARINADVFAEAARAKGMNEHQRQYAEKQAAMMQKEAAKFYLWSRVLLDLY